MDQNNNNLPTLMIDCHVSASQWAQCAQRNARPRTTKYTVAYFDISHS